MPAFASRAASAAATLAQLAHSVWRADQMGSCRTAVTSTGHHTLDNELPNGGWPGSVLIELLLQQPGIGEMRLLKPALTAIAKKRRVALVQPPHLPQVSAWSAWGLAPERLLWIRTGRSADALWTAEQVLQNGSCGALLFWQSQVRPEALRRLHLTAQGSDTVFWMVRPLATAQDASPAPLRLALRPAHAGLAIEIVKRRGPQRDDAFYLPLDAMSAAPSNLTLFNHAPVDRCALAAATSRNISSALV
jgi:protein ImuA